MNKKQIEEKLTPVDLEAIYCEMIDEEGPINILGCPIKRSDALRTLNYDVYKNNINMLLHSGDYEYIGTNLYRVVDIEQLLKRK